MFEELRAKNEPGKRKRYEGSKVRGTQTVKITITREMR